MVPASEASFAQLARGHRAHRRLRQYLDAARHSEIALRIRLQGWRCADCRPQKPEQTTWATAWDLPYEKLSRDYAIVARIHDNTTGQPVIIAAGISEEGTEAAGEILYNPVYLDTLLSQRSPQLGAVEYGSGD